MEGVPSRPPADLQMVRVKRIAAVRAGPEEAKGPNVENPQEGTEPGTQGPKVPSEENGPVQVVDGSDEEWPEPGL